MFGGVVVAHDGAPLGRRPRLVLARLVAAHDRLVTDDQLIDAIWGDDPPRSARTALQGYVSTLRDAVEPDRERHDQGPSVVRDLNGYRLDSSAVDVDLVEFESAVAAALGSSNGRESEAFADRAIELSQGDPFPEFADAPWAREVRRWVGARRAAVLAQRLATEVGTGGVAALWDAHREYPDHERIAALLMAALYRNGEQRTALRVYADVRRSLVEGAGIDPGPELEAVYLDVLEHRLPAANGPRSDSSDPSTAERTSVRVPPGRANDVDVSVSAALDHGTVTLLGPVGIGKTTCSAAVAAEIARQQGAVVCEVDVAAVPSGELEEEIARALGVTTHPRTPVSALAASAARTTPLVLRLETCEAAHEEVASFLVELGATPGITTVLTSRVPVGHSGECGHRLEPLGIDDAVDVLVSGRARPFGADERERLAGLAESLDRIPLGLVMAAARLDGLGIEGVERAIRAGTLEAARPDAPDRHASTTAAVEWSLRLLDDEQRALLERLALLSRPVPYAAVEKLVGAAVGSATSTLASLVEASLVTRDAGSPPTFRVLEAVRGVVTSSSSAPFDAVVAVVIGEVVADVMVPDPTRDRRWALDQASGLIAELLRRRDDRVLALAAASSAAWLDSGEISTLRAAIEPLAAHPICASASPTNRVIIGSMLGAAQLQQGDWGATRRTITDAAALVDEAVDVAGGSSLLRAIDAWLRLDLETAWQHASTALDGMTGSTRWTPSGLITISYIAVWVGKLDDAADCLAKARRIAVDQGSQAGEAEALLRGAVVEAMSGRLDTASRWARRGSALAAATGSPVRQARAEAVLSLVAWTGGDIDDARSWSERFGRSTGQVYDAAAVMLGVPPAAAVAATDRDLRRAAMLLGWLDSVVEHYSFAHHPGSHGALSDAQEMLTDVDPIDLRRWRAEGAGLQAIDIGRLMAGESPAAMV